jgi:hypothetical protein
MMNGSPVCYNQDGDKASAGGWKGRSHRTACTYAREAWSMYCTCMMVEQCDFLEAIVCQWCAKPVLKGMDLLMY